MFSFIGEFVLLDECNILMTPFVYSWSRFYAAMAIMVYALITYHWRAAAIRRRDTGPYDDRLGPVRNQFLCEMHPLTPTHLCRQSCVSSFSVSPSIRVKLFIVNEY